jgi:hypothetical protein
MPSYNQPEIYFHAGLGRTATTFLQTAIFPKFKDIYYIRKKQFKNADRILASGNHTKYLISKEFYSGHITEGLYEFSRKYPDAGIILVLRRQDTFIASHYKRSIKKGHATALPKYFDLDHDTGYRKVDDLYFYPKLKAIESYFNRKPLVLFHHELKSDPESFVRKILSYTGVTDTHPISYKPLHTSYTDKELQFRQWFSRNTALQEIPFKGYRFSGLRRFYNKTLRYSLLSFSKLLPGSLISDEPILPEAYLERVRKTYEQDWEQCLQYARENETVSA